MRKSIAQFQLDFAVENYRDQVNRMSAIKRERDVKRKSRILRKGLTLLIKV